jgi:hypothetical protein
MSIIEITSNITSNTVFFKNYIYVMVGEIHVTSDITVIMEDNVVIYIRNGIFLNTNLRRSALIFDTGSKLIASNFYVLACDIYNIPSIIPDNGGLWFVGSASNIKKDGISAYFGPKSSNFSAIKIYAYYLGSKDPNQVVNISSTEEPSADQDGITSLGCGNNEWNIQGVYIERSGDNAFDIVNSNITMNEIEIYYPGEDALNIQSGQLNVIKTLTLFVPLTEEMDRDIFDLEIDNGTPYIRIERFCYVEILGIFGDQTILVSDDMPQPKESIYYYKGVMMRGQTYIYAITD